MINDLDSTEMAAVDGGDLCIYLPMGWPIFIDDGTLCVGVRFEL